MTAAKRPAWGATQAPRLKILTDAEKLTGPIELVLGRMSGVRHGQRGQYFARCPAHNDREPSLTIRETSEHAVLLHCFAGCSVQDITVALGLDMADLYPLRESMLGGPRRIPRLLTAGQALQLLRQEAGLILVSASSLARGVPLTEQDHSRLLAAVGRMEYLCVESLGARHG